MGGLDADPCRLRATLATLVRASFDIASTAATAAGRLLITIKKGSSTAEGLDAGRGSRFARQGLLVVVLGLAYVLSATLMLRLANVHQIVGAVWPGLPLAAIRRFGYRAWPGIALGEFTVSMTHHRSVAEALGLSVNDTLAAVVGAWVLGRVGFNNALERTRDVFTFVLLAAGVSTLSATFGVGTLALLGSVPRAEVSSAWTTWWIANTIGNLVVASMLITWTERSPAHAPRRWIEFGALLCATAALGSLVFAEWPRIGLALNLHSYVIFTVLIWAALRFGPLGASAAIFVVAVVAIAGTARQYGPFAGPSLSENLTNLQGFLGIVASSTLVLAAVARERERATAARDEFMAIAAHELRTPLAALRLQVEAMLRVEAGTSRAPSTTQLAKVRRTTRQVNRLEQLVNALLDVERIDRKWGPPYVHERIDVAVLVRDVADRYLETLSLASCPLEIRADAPVWANCDGSCVEQVVTNLLANATKFGAGQPVTLSVWQADDAAFISVQDHGIGIAQVDQARIFERFERAVSARHYGGLGLGLYVARQLISGLGGSIRVESAPGAGATFIVELPASRAERIDEHVATPEVSG